MIDVSSWCVDRRLHILISECTLFILEIGRKWRLFRRLHTGVILVTPSRSAIGLIDRLLCVGLMRLSFTTIGIILWPFSVLILVGILILVSVLLRIRIVVRHGSGEGNGKKDKIGKALRLPLAAGTALRSLAVFGVYA